MTLSWDRVADVAGLQAPDDHARSPASRRSTAHRRPTTPPGWSPGSRSRPRTPTATSWSPSAKARPTRRPRSRRSASTRCCRPTAPEGPTESPTHRAAAARRAAAVEATTRHPAVRPSLRRRTRCRSSRSLNFYPVDAGDDQATRAEEDRAELAEQDLETKVLLSDDWTITPPLSGGPATSCTSTVRPPTRRPPPATPSPARHRRTCRAGAWRRSQRHPEVIVGRASERSVRAGAGRRPHRSRPGPPVAWRCWGRRRRP